MRTINLLLSLRSRTQFTCIPFSWIWPDCIGRPGRTRCKLIYRIHTFWRDRRSSNHEAVLRKRYGGISSTRASVCAQLPVPVLRRKQRQTITKDVHMQRHLRKQIVSAIAHGCTLNLVTDHICNCCFCFSITTFWFCAISVGAHVCMCNACIYSHG